MGVFATETPRDVSFCAWAIHESDVFVVPDATQDKRFAENPLVVLDPKFRFYAGAPLTIDGNATLCVTDRVPRQLTEDQLQALRVLSELRHNLTKLKTALAARDQAEADRDRTIDELRATLGKVREGPLSICLSCKRIQDDKGKGEPFERYVRTHSEAKISHKICADCESAISV